MCCFSIQSTGKTDFAVAMLRFVGAQAGCLAHHPDSLSASPELAATRAAAGDLQPNLLAEAKPAAVNVSEVGS